MKADAIIPIPLPTSKRDRTRRVTIVGANAREFTPFRGELWGLNAIRPTWAKHFPWTRWFNLHRYDHMARDWATGLVDEIWWAQQHPEIPFYKLDDEWPTTVRLPNPRIFPREAIRRFFKCREYHAGSFDWLVAYAIYLRFQEIRIHGVNLNLESGEPISARACLEYWCGQAEARGIRVVTVDCGFFCQYHYVRSQTLYGYDDVKLVEDRASGRID